MQWWAGDSGRRGLPYSSGLADDTERRGLPCSGGLADDTGRRGLPYSSGLMTLEGGGFHTAVG